MAEKSPFDEEDELHYRSPEEEKKVAAWEKPPKELPAAKRAEVRDEEV